LQETIIHVWKRKSLAFKASIQEAKTDPKKKASKPREGFGRLNIGHLCYACHANGEWEFERKTDFGLKRMIILGATKTK